MSFDRIQGLLKTKTAALVAGAGIAVAAVAGIIAVMNKPLPLEFQKGVVYCSWSETGYMERNSEDSLKRVKGTNADHVSVLVTWYQANCWSGNIHRMETTPSDEAVIFAIQKAHELGMKVMLKPHLDILDKSDGSWRGEIGCVKEADWDQWFEDYENFISHYAKIAEEQNVELLCVGTELSTSATAKGYKWKEMIKRIRSKYSGALTYAAHWDRYQDIRFWDVLDYVGINAYFPLTENMKPSYEELKEGWTPWVEEMESFQARVKKPVIFPEIGCNSSDGAAIRPWEHAPRREVNLQLQYDYYKVLMEIFFQKDWFYGLYWWYWGTNPNMGGEFNRSFTPQNKPAEGLIKEWYAKPVSRDKEWNP